MTHGRFLVQSVPGKLCLISITTTANANHFAGLLKKVALKIADLSVLNRIAFQSTVFQQPAKISTRNGTGSNVNYLHMKKVKSTIDPLFLSRHEKKECISVIVPTHRLSPERRGDALEVKRAVERAGEQLRVELSEAESAALISSLQALYASIPFEHSTDGIGLFVAPKVQELVYFHFPVKEKIIVGHTFEIRDILYQSYYLQPYQLLLVTENSVRLFNGLQDTLTEVKDAKFPLNYTEDYEYNPPSPSSSYRGYAVLQQSEKDKSRMESIRHAQFFGEADSLLHEYLQPALPLVVAGDKKDLALFTKESRHSQQIVGTVAGNYSHRPEQELGRLAWTTVQRFLAEAQQELVQVFTEKTGAGLGVAGIEQVWKAVNEGRGFQLLVEKDFTQPGFVKKSDAYSLHLHRPPGACEVFPDAVNELLLRMLEKNGEVRMLENGQLVNQQGIALITRY
jgi:hypothetical protein